MAPLTKSAEATGTEASTGNGNGKRPKAEAPVSVFEVVEGDLPPVTRPGRGPSNEYVDLCTKVAEEAGKGVRVKVKVFATTTGANSVRRDLAKGLKRFPGNAAPDKHWVFESRTEGEKSNLYITFISESKIENLKVVDPPKPEKAKDAAAEDTAAE